MQVSLNGLRSKVKVNSLRYFQRLDSVKYFDLRREVSSISSRYHFKKPDFVNQCSKVVLGARKMADFETGNGSEMVNVDEIPVSDEIQGQGQVDTPTEKATQQVGVEGLVVTDCGCNVDVQSGNEIPADTREPVAVAAVPLAPSAELDLLSLTNNSDATEAMLTKCKEYALDKDCHETLLKDPVLCPFIVLCLGSESSVQVQKGLEIFLALAKQPGNRIALSNIFQFFTALKDVASNSKLPKPTRELALYIAATVKKGNKAPMTQSQPQNVGANVFKVDSTVQKTESKSGLKGSENKPSSGTKKSGNTSKSVRQIQLYVPQCSAKEQRLMMTGALVQVAGVVSITYDMKKLYCVIRAKPIMPSEIFGKTIANLGLECHLVCRSETDPTEEVLVKMQPDPKLENSLSAMGKENTIPEYLNDSLDEEPDKSVAGNAVARMDEKDKKERKGWMSSASSFLQKSFYW